MKDKLMNSLKKRRVRKNRYERLSNESLEKRLAFNASPVLTDADLQFASFGTGDEIPVGEVGVLVSSLIDSGGVNNNYFDADEDNPGIAITGVNLQGGQLYVSIDSGQTWEEITTASDSAAKLLAADEDTRIYYSVPSDFYGLIQDVVTFRAWDTQLYSNSSVVDINGSEYKRVGTYNTSGHAYGVTLSADGNYAYVADRSSGLQIIDVSTPASPTRVGTYNTSGYAYGVTLSSDGKYAYVADGSPGLQIIDVSTPASPTRVGTYNTSGSAYGVTLSADGKYAYVADGSPGLQIIDVSTPASPTRVGTYNTSGTANGVTLSADGKYAYVTDGLRGLQIIDVSTPASPRRVGIYNTSGTANGVTLSADGKYAYVADGSPGLQIIDVSTPASPTSVGTYNTSGTAFRVTLSADGKYAYVAGLSSGLQIIDVSTPASPTSVGTYNTSGDVYGVTLSSDETYAYVADYSSGLQIIKKVNPGVFSKQIDSIAAVYLTVGTEDVKENSVVGSLVGTVIPVNPGWQNPSSYALISGEGDNDNASVEIRGTKIFAKTSFDYERQNSYSIRMRASSPEGLSYELITVFSVTDVNEAPTDILLTNNQVNENESPNTFIGTLSTIDQDAGETFSYEIIQDADAESPFHLKGNELYSSQSFNFEQESSHQVVVRSTDANGLSYEKHIEIELLDVNEAPILDTSPSIILDDNAVGEFLPGLTSGKSVNEIIDFGGVHDNFFDEDGNAKGIALIGTEVGDGTLWYTINNGESWDKVGDVSPTNARVLAADSRTKIYYQVSNISEYDAQENVLTFKAWDRSGGWRNGDIGINTTILSALTSQTTGLWDLPTFGAPNYARGLKLSPDGRYAYLIDPADGLHVFDVEAPTSLERLTDYITDGPINDLVFSADGTFAYIANEKVGVQVLNVAVPSSPRLVSSIRLENRTQSLLLSSDNRLIISEENGLISVFDMSDHQSPQLLSSVSVQGQPGRMTVSDDGSHLFVANGTNGFAVISLLDDSVPAVVSNVDTPGYAYDVQLNEDGTHLLVADGDSGLSIWSLETLSSPQRVATVNTGGRAYDVTLVGDRKHVLVACHDGGLKAINIQSPSVPTVAWAWNTDGQTYETVMSSDGRFTFIADGDRGIRSHEIGFLANLDLYPTTGAVNDTAVSKDGEWFYAVTEDYLYSYRKDSDSKLSPISRHRVSQDSYHTATSVAVSEDGRHVFVGLGRLNYNYSGGRGKSQVLVFDVLDQSSPTLIQTITPENYSTPHTLTVGPDGRYLFVGTGEIARAVQVVDISTILDPKIVAIGKVSIYGSSSSRETKSVALTSDGRYAFTASEYMGVTVFDLDITTNPKKILSFGDSYSRIKINQATSLSFSKDDKLLLIVDGDDGIHIYDTADPTQPKRISQINTPGYALSVAFSHDERYAFVADQAGGVQVIDLLVKEEPKIVGSIETPGNAYSVELSPNGEQLIVSTDRGVQVVGLIASPSFSVETDIVGTLVNTPPQNFQLSGGVVSENSAIGTAVGSLSATDVDAGDTLSFGFVSGDGDDDNERFYIEGSKLFVNQIFDYEVQNSFKIRLAASDSTGGTVEKMFEVLLTDVVETPTGTQLILTAADGVISIDADIAFDPTRIDLLRIDVAEGLPQGAIAEVNVLSPGLAKLGISLPSALAARSYVLGFIKANLLGGETSSPEALLELRNIRLNEGNLPSTTESGFKLLRVGNSSPTLITLSNASLSESASVGSVVGVLSTADTDPSDQITYELVSGEGDAGNDRFSIVDNELKTRVLFDYESAPSHEIRVRATARWW